MASDLWLSNIYQRTNNLQNSNISVFLYFFQRCSQNLTQNLASNIAYSSLLNKQDHLIFLLLIKHRQAWNKTKVVFQIYIYISHHNITIYKVIVSFDTEALHYLYRMMSKSYGYVSEQRKGLIIRFVVIFAATLSFSSM